MQNSLNLNAHLHHLHINIVAGAPLTLLLPPSPQYDAVCSPSGASQSTHTLTESVLHNTAYKANREWNAFIHAYISLLHAPDADIWPAIVRCYTTLTTLFIQSSSSTPTNGNTQIAPALRSLTTLLPKLALRTSGEASSQAASLLSRALAASNVDIASRRVLLVHITNMLSYTYFKLQRLHSLPTALKAVIPLEDALEDRYSMADITTYRYWRARSLLAEWKIGAAYAHFERAYRGCWAGARANRRRIAAYWLTTALVLRRCPTRALLQRNDLEWPFAELFDHARTGDLKQLFRCLDDKSVRDFFVAMGQYTMLREKIECVVHRSLLRRTLRVYMELKHTSNPIIPLGVFLKTLQCAHVDEELDVDDAEAVAVSLIEQGFVGASIQHSSRTLVFAKSDQSAFPSSSSSDI